MHDQKEISAKCLYLGTLSAVRRIFHMFIFGKYMYFDTNLTLVFFMIHRQGLIEEMFYAHGQRLLALCILTDLLFANGVLRADKSADMFTFSSLRGERAVDYLLLEPDEFSTLGDFKIFIVHDFSDH